MKAVTIIGGGFCGTMVLYHLMQHNDLPPLHVSFYDVAGAHGRGFAYSTMFEEHLLNVQATGMSALPDKADDFLKWLPQGAEASTFYPRKTYGDYLYSYHQKSLALAANKKHVVDIHSSYAPENNDGITVVATGTHLPVWPQQQDFPAALFLPHPYGTAFKELISNQDSFREVIILGMGLSAVDAVLSLHKSGYAGKITVISRHALWPFPHGPKNRFWHWRKYIDALRPYSNRIWIRLPHALKRFLLKRMTYWNIARHRMPPQCHAIIRQMEKSGQLARVKADIRDYMQKKSFAGCAVINCLGYIRPNKAAGASGEKHIFKLGPPLFGHYIETTAVPELKVQAKEVADAIAALVKNENR